MVWCERSKKEGPGVSAQPPAKPQAFYAEAFFSPSESTSLVNEHHLPTGLRTEQDQNVPYTPRRSFIGLSCTGQWGTTAASAACGVSILLGLAGKALVCALAIPASCHICALLPYVSTILS